MYTPGQLYNRRNDIHASFGGQRQGGISTPKSAPFVFLFTGESGESFGYSDGWTKGGVFKYTGEGQLGDMEFVKGNKAIRDHAINGKDLLLFQALGSGKPYRFVGRFACQDWEIEQRPDRSGAKRSSIAFLLASLDTEPTKEISPASLARGVKEPLGLDELRRRAYEAATLKSLPKERRVAQTVYQRAESVREYILARSEGRCECCKAQAPFARVSGEPYLEPHHTRRVSDGGPDHPRWVAAVCPNCHREIHFGQNGQRKNAELGKYLEKLEPEPA